MSPGARPRRRREDGPSIRGRPRSSGRRRRHRPPRRPAPRWSGRRGRQQLGADRLLAHQAVVALGLHRLGHLAMSARGPAPSTFSYLKQPTRASLASRSQSSSRAKSSSVSPGKPTMKVERMARSGQVSRQRRCARASSPDARAGASPSAPSGSRAGRECRDKAGRALGHQRQHLIDMRIGIDVMQPHPGAERAERLRRSGSAPRGPRRARRLRA